MGQHREQVLMEMTGSRVLLLMAFLQRYPALKLQISSGSLMLLCKSELGERLD